MKGFIILFMALALCACHPVGPNQGPLVPRPPGNAVETRPGPGLDQLAPGGLSLDQAIDLALANNPEALAMDFDAKAARARLDQSLAQRWPNLGLSAGYTRHLDQQRLLPAGEPGAPVLLSRNTFSGELLLSWPLIDARIFKDIQAKESLSRFATHQLRRKRSQLIFEVSSQFFAILAQKRVCASLRTSRRSLREHLIRVQALFKGQKAAGVDVMRTRVQLADIGNRLLDEQRRLQLLRRGLANSLGLDLGLGDTKLCAGLSLSPRVQRPEMAPALARAWEARQDYLAAKSAMRAKALDLECAQAEVWPRLSVQGAYGQRFAAGSTTGKGDKQGDLGRVGLAVEVPIFAGGQVRAEINEQRAELAAARQRLRQLRLKIRLEVETALTNIDTYQAQLRGLKSAVDQAREGLRLERLKYELEKGRIVDVLDARAAFLRAETSYYQVLARLKTSQVQLQLAVGEL